MREDRFETQLSCNRVFYDWSKTKFIKYERREIGRNEYNLQAYISEPFLGVAHTERTVTLGTNFTPLKLLNAVHKSIITRSLLSHNPPATARSRTHRYPLPLHHFTNTSNYTPLWCITTKFQQEKPIFFFLNTIKA